MDAIFEDTSRDKSLRKALQISANNRLEGEEVLSEIPQLSTETSLANVEQKTEEAFRQEIQFLEAACQQYGSELLHLRALAKEHAMLSRELDDMQEAIAEDQISLELEARAFDNDQQRLSRELVDIEDEVDRLSSPEIRLPATTLHLQVDVERGLRYPLINELRLAYRPKGDVHWEEIQAAWALAADLLLVIASVFEFQSQHWKIVPLSHCAKLIYRLPSERGINATDNPKAQDNKPRLIVFNIGHPKTNGSKALLAWNGLMYQVIQHVQNHISDATENGVLEREEIPPLPVQISSTGIGGTALPQLDDGDDFGWSRAINCMALDLLWLSDCASTFVLKRVLMQAALSTGKTVLQTE